MEYLNVSEEILSTGLLQKNVFLQVHNLQFIENIHGMRTLLTN